MGKSIISRLLEDSKETTVSAPAYKENTKRLRINDKNISNTSNRLSHDTPRFMELMEQKIHQMSLQISAKISFKISTQIKESEDRILSRIDIIDVKLCAVFDRISELEKTISEIFDLKEKVDKLKLFIDKQENSLIAGELRINGIPFEDNKNLFNVFENICSTIELPVPNINLKRIYNFKTKRNKVAPVISLKLSSSQDKNIFFKIFG
ncbi:hypothetical protein CVS40_10441 [Lucilia cuprina]|nr:hypothetical protein CVS40_10441 [Lucilia cuprina]